MSTKRIILANGSRLLREMLKHVINKAENLQVVQEIANYDELPSAIERHDPQWVILSMARDNHLGNWMEASMASHPSLRFACLSPDRNSIIMKWQPSREEEVINPSLSDFIQILEKDLQHI